MECVCVCLGGICPLLSGYIIRSAYNLLNTSLLPTPLLKRYVSNMSLNIWNLSYSHSYHNLRVALTWPRQKQSQKSPSDHMPIGWGGKGGYHNENIFTTMHHNENIF